MWHCTRGNATAGARRGPQLACRAWVYRRTLALAGRAWKKFYEEKYDVKIISQYTPDEDVITIRTDYE